MPESSATLQTHALDRPVMIAAGGTGGHVYPALAVARVLRQQDVPVVWLGTAAGLEARVVPADGFAIEWINISGLRGKSILQTAFVPFRLAFSLLQTWRVFNRCKPRAVLGMGGFVAGPGSIVALLRRKPLIIHEQNSVAGLTNRWVGRFASRIYTAFPSVFDNNKTVMEIGNPVRPEIEAIEDPAKRLQRPGPCQVLVVGGSLGARSLNTHVPKALAACGQSLAIWHQTGEADHQNTLDAYQQLGLQARVNPYIEEIVDAYSWADLIICRSGAMTVSELAAAGLCGVLIPYPFHKDNQQVTNAQWLVDADAAILLSNDELNGDSLAAILKPLLADREHLIRMSINARALHKPNAANTVAEALLEAADS